MQINRLSNALRNDKSTPYMCQYIGELWGPSLLHFNRRYHDKKVIPALSYRNPHVSLRHIDHYYQNLEEQGGRSAGGRTRD